MCIRDRARMMFCYLCSEYAINGWLVTYIQSKTELLSAFGQTAPLPYRKKASAAGNDRYNSHGG